MNVSYKLNSEAKQRVRRHLQKSHGGVQLADWSENQRIVG